MFISNNNNNNNNTILVLILMIKGISIISRRIPTAGRHRSAQCSDSENEHSVVTAMVLIVLNGTALTE